MSCPDRLRTQPSPRVMTRPTGTCAMQIPALASYSSGPLFRAGMSKVVTG
jgi:hypothetical protein